MTMDLLQDGAHDIPLSQMTMDLLQDGAHDIPLSQMTMDLLQDGAHDIPLSQMTMDLLLFTLMFSLLYQCQALLPDLSNTVGVL